MIIWMQVVHNGLQRLDMFRWMCGKTRNDKVKNRYQRNLETKLIEDNILIYKLSLFGHVQHNHKDICKKRA